MYLDVFICNCAHLWINIGICVCYTCVCRPQARRHGAGLGQGPRGYISCLFVLYLLIIKQGLKQSPKQGPMGQVYGKAPGAIFHVCLYFTCLLKGKVLSKAPSKAPWGRFQARPQGRYFLVVCIALAYKKARFKARPQARPHGAGLGQGRRGDISCLFVLYMLIKRQGLW